MSFAFSCPSCHLKVYATFLFKYFPSQISKLYFCFIHNFPELFHRWQKLTYFHWYSQGVRTSVKTLGANISINKACNPINLGAKLKLLFSSLQYSPWMLELDLYWQSYDRKTDCNLNYKKLQNESVRHWKFNNFESH